MLSGAPAEFKEQLIYREDTTCAQILYRTVVHVGSSDKVDRQFTQDLLFKPRIIEVGKLYNHLIRWTFAKDRLKKYGFQNPDDSFLLETLKVAVKINGA